MCVLNPNLTLIPRVRESAYVPLTVRLKLRWRGEPYSYACSDPNLTLILRVRVSAEGTVRGRCGAT